MKQIRWIVAAMLIAAMLLLGGCSGRDDGMTNDGMTNDGMVNDGVVDDGMTDQNGSAYSNRRNDGQNHNGNGGVLSDIADGMENGIDRIKDGMDTVEDDVRTDLGENNRTGN